MGNKTRLKSNNARGTSFQTFFFCLLCHLLLVIPEVYTKINSMGFWVQAYGHTSSSAAKLEIWPFGILCREAFHMLCFPHIGYMSGSATWCQTTFTHWASIVHLRWESKQESSNTYTMHKMICFPDNFFSVYCIARFLKNLVGRAYIPFNSEMISTHINRSNL